MVGKQSQDVPFLALSQLGHETIPPICKRYCQHHDLEGLVTFLSFPPLTERYLWALRQRSTKPIKKVI